MPRRWALRILAYPLPLDLAVSGVAYGLYWVTFSAVAGLMCSGFTAVGRRLIGWIDARGYHAGVFAVQL
jgi:hypothetical protein